MEKKRRPFTLTGGIVNIVFASLDIIATLIIFISMMELEYSSPVGLDSTYLIVYTVTCFLEFVFAIVIIILTSILLAKCSLPVERFNKYTGLIITLFVFDCIAVIGSLINAINGNYFAIVVLLVYAMCAIFIMLDLCANKKELKNPATEENKEVVKVEKMEKKVEDNKKTQAVPAQNNGNTSVSKLYQTLSEIKEMKENEIITEDEYKKLKAKLIDKYEF